ncbi:MAG: hypothetical protein M3261_05970, partial [Thermoproteota archaeon]|nr:hypothetical protein [Thermoproteota archaeon]
MSGRKVAVIVSVVAAAVAVVTISAVFLMLQNQNLLTIFATKSNNNTDSSSNAGKLTIIFASDSSLTNQSGYVISPDPFGNLANYTIRDGSGADENKAPGIVEISGLPLGTY